MKCANHPERSADTFCNYCGKSICSDCQVEIKQEHYCRECAGAKAAGEAKIEHSPALAGILSFIIAGLGQIYNGQYAKGLFIFFTSWLIVPWVIGIFDAYETAKKIRAGQAARQVKVGCLIGSAVAVAAGAFFMLVMLVAGVVAVKGLKDSSGPYEEHARTVVNLVGVAAENYAENHGGVYPRIEADLVDEHYLAEGVGGTTKKGYAYSVEFGGEGYRIIARPVRCGQTTTEIYTMTQEGGMTVSSCREDQ